MKRYLGLYTTITLQAPVDIERDGQYLHKWIGQARNWDEAESELARHTATLDDDPDAYWIEGETWS